MRKEVIGGATLYCGDALAALASLSTASVTSLITDPPYSSGGQFRGDRMLSTVAKYVDGRQAQTGNHAAAFSGDNRDQRAYAYWSALWLAEARRVLAPGSLAAVFTDWRQLPTTTDAFQAGGLIWRGILAWDKTEAARPMKGRFRNQCEYAVWGSSGAMPIVGPCLPGVLRMAVGRSDKEHIAGKPVSLLAEMMPIAGSVVLDPFMGSGTTGVAAVQDGRGFVGVEMDHAHFDTACRRIEAAQRQVRLAA